MYRSTLLKFYLYGIFFFAMQNLCFAQPNIGGVINKYSPVVLFDTSSCAPKITVTNGNLFNTGDKVLIIQMKGALIDLTNTSSFGDVTNYKTVGNYEFSRVNNVTGNVVTLITSLKKKYDKEDRVQLIYVPEYTNVNVTGLLTASPWDGSSGGVLVFDVSNTLQLLNDIDVSGKGFRGGTLDQNGDGGCATGNNNYYYTLASRKAAQKGEGIIEYSTNYEAGMGSLANGGGGGNKHNSGGGGGSNYTSGGKGGNQADFCPVVPIGGEGGKALNYSLGKIFLGGGGGSGNKNDGVGTSGTNGGGIILVTANTVIGNGQSILSNGRNVASSPNGIGDGEGGGGAGGTVLLNVTTFSGSLNVKANGGNGGTQYTSYPACFGPGGGGGTGIVWFKNNSLPSGINLTMNSGVAGKDLNPSSSCYNTSYGASSGSTNVSGPLFNFLIPTIGPATGPGAKVKLPNDTLVCDSIILDPVGSFNDYKWQDGSTDSFFVVRQPGIYWVVVHDQCLRMSRDSIVVEFALEKPNLGNDRFLCNSGAVTLNAGVGYKEYLWQDGSTGNSFYTSTPGIYWVEVKNTCDKIFRDSVKLTIGSSALPVLPSDTYLCDSLVLDPGGPFVSYVWQNSSTDSFFVVKQPGVYWVKVKNQCSVNSFIDSIRIVAPHIKPELGDDKIICNESISKTFDAGTGYNSYLWKDGSNASTFHSTDLGIYWVAVTNECNDTFRDSVKIVQSNHLKVSAKMDTSLACVNEYITLTAKIDSCKEWVKNPVIGNAKLQPCNEPSFLWNTQETTKEIKIPSKNSSASYKVILTNINGCSDDYIITTPSIACIERFIPNLITVNNDGQNDYFELIGFFNQATVKIYNRWGDLVYTSSQYQNNWKADQLSEGIYFYEIRDHKNRFYKNWVQVIK